MLCPLPGLLGGWYDVLMGVGVRRRGGSCVVVLGGVGVGRAGSWAWAAVMMCAGGSVAAAMTGASGFGGGGGTGWAVAGGGLRLASNARIVLF